jgi:hypothetical protein
MDLIDDGRRCSLRCVEKGGKLEAEFQEIIEERLKNADRGEFTEGTPRFWKGRKRDGKRIRELTVEGNIGNLMLPEELYDFVKERMASGECQTPTDVVVAAMLHLRRSRQEERRKARRAPLKRSLSRKKKR